MNRAGQTWQEDRKIFIVVGSPEVGALWSRHPVCYIDDAGETPIDQKYVDEGEILWEQQPYMQRIS